MAATLKITVFMQPDADITVVVTSCNRHDLLARTLESFRAQETEGRVARILVAEDGDADPSQVCARFGAAPAIAGPHISPCFTILMPNGGNLLPRWQGQKHPMRISAMRLNFAIRAMAGRSCRPSRRKCG